MTDSPRPLEINANALRISTIRLFECLFSINAEFAPVDGEALDLQFRFGVERKRLSPTRGVVRFQVAAFEAQPSAPFQVRVTYEGVFEADEGQEASLTEYMRANALATLAPYLREALSSLSSRAGYQPLVLPPLNAVALAQQFDETEQARTTTEVSPNPSSD